jgi:Holliday junction resolvasome RuvABC DNA-binding subunit
MAGRVVVELKDRIGPADGVVSGPLSEVREALLALGLSAEEAREAVAALGTNGDRPVQEMLREALRGVGR